ncbi:D-alanyl-D-alanine carboxypeptidase [Chryseosolibacter indicus]|uniref:D-alanyl-D-alanine carboxypeptidase n=1 Tax=Chryseosolibacter indicus TaxID=2782351 RepID=A0ABS5VNT2_9BACT|nr:D-alanyl-D-alanine carboxypeptidase [Chryseosolibacter indicus]MBT1703104.1 D-alanyl-D-alanine carboxypeptidase [Chryseosolibacter indicus]
MRFLFYFIVIAVVTACSSSKRLGLPKAFKETDHKFQDHTGFMLYDVDKKKVIYEYNSNKYFTPASNTKIFTFYTSLRIIGDSIPALKYVERNDSLIFWGTGDPSFLYKFTYNNNRLYNFLQKHPKSLYFSNANFSTSHFGSGWAWDDYNSAYSPERSPFPVYGNIFTVKKSGSLLRIYPSYFEKHFAIGERREREEVVRELHSNDFKIHPGVRSPQYKEWDIPIRLNQLLITDLLTDTLKRAVTPVHTKLSAPAIPYYSIPADSLFRVMMQESDNFIAEQLLLICAGIVRDTLKPEIAIKYSIENYLQDLPDKPIWVDGSGLSRYNLFTPRSIVKLWEKIYEQRPKERLFPLLATGGVNGTVKNWYKADKPYFFGKTGTLSNNHTLSGFLVTKSGKTLIFSFMNNNYVTSTSEIRKNMQEILYNIYNQY